MKKSLVLTLVLALFASFVISGCGFQSMTSAEISIKYGNLTLAQIESIVDKLGGMDGVEQFLRGESVVSIIGVPTESSLVKHLGSVEIPAQARHFVVADDFVVDTSDGAVVKISNVWNGFKEYFLDKVEKPCGSLTLNYGILQKGSVDGPIIVGLGWEAKVETTLGAVFFLMKKQRNGESGILLTNGYANIFYIRDTKNELRAVRVYWNGDGWRVYAVFVSGPNEWYEGCQVFSR